MILSFPIEKNMILKFDWIWASHERAELTKENIGSQLQPKTINLYKGPKRKTRKPKDSIAINQSHKNPSHHHIYIYSYWRQLGFLGEQQTERGVA